MLSTAEAASRLGVRPQTLYAYVSRGLLRSVPRGAPGGRGSGFHEDEVARLAGRSRSRPAQGLGPAIVTEITSLANDRLRYRGQDAVELARAHRFEDIATLLWTGTLAEAGPFDAPDPKTLTTARRVIAAAPEGLRLADALKISAAVASALDPDRFDLAEQRVLDRARALLALFAGALPNSGPGHASVAETLWPALTALAPTQERIDLLDLALCLLADHGLAVSTVAARVAASARAHPAAVVVAGLGAIDGRYHGGASQLAHDFLTGKTQAPAGFGHSVYQESDPRADALLGALREYAAGDERARRALARALHVAEEQRRQAGTFPNSDFALATLVSATGMRADAGEAVFALARAAGWIAHALEEYREPGLRFRVGSSPRPSPSSDGEL